MFPCEVCKIFKKIFFYRTPRVSGSAPPVAASVFFKKSNQAALLWRTNNFFFSTHRLMCKSRSRLFINLSSIVKFSKLLRQGVPYKAKNWHTWSHEQYFWKQRFLGICRCAFNKWQNWKFCKNCIRTQSLLSSKGKLVQLSIPWKQQLRSYSQHDIETI